MFLLPKTRLFQRSLLNGRYIARSYLVRQRLHAEAQKHRSLVQVQGSEASSFLQGLITNDMEHLEQGALSMFSMVLNTQGRILFDVIVYKKEDHTFIIECDASSAQQMIKHLKMYRVRRKINVDSVDDKYRVWALFDRDINFEDITPMDMESLYMNPKSESDISIDLSKSSSDETLATRDPRLRYLGHRLIIPVQDNIKDIVSGTEIGEGLYKNMRYRLGVCEGGEEIPLAKCFPLETNCDYMHGVSFHKGCYIGQELTARTFHTGVVRKRYMPIKFPSDASHLAFDTAVTNEKGKAVGKVRGNDGEYGIGLMRIQECMAAKELVADGLIVDVLKPAWWPYEASKARPK